MAHVEKFLLELGAGFALVGRQVHLEVGDQDFYLDLLFYHLKLRCYVVIDLKAREFTPEAAMTLVVPTADLCHRFGDFAAPLSRQILKLERQIQNLRRTRDLLLPRLLSGQVELS